MADDRKKIYQSISVEEVEQEREAFAVKWDEKFPTISPIGRCHWSSLLTLFDYPDGIRKVIDTTHAIESLNSMIRKAVSNRKIFSHDQAVMLRRSGRTSGSRG